MSKVAEAMEVYEIILIDHTLKEAKALLDERGYIIMEENEEIRLGDNTRVLATLIVEGLEDPRRYFKDIRKTRKNVVGQSYYCW